MPPRTALTFAAMWDPEDGMVTFSGARLLDSETLEKKATQDDSPRDVAFADDQSQVLTVDRFGVPTGADAYNPYAYPCPHPHLARHRQRRHAHLRRRLRAAELRRPAGLGRPGGQG